jgi:single-stranded DNA-binding protein
MVDTNYISGIVKILENPVQTVFKNTIPVTTFRVQLPQVRNNIIINLVFWGNLARDVASYYQINDYVLIEGYLSLRDKKIADAIGKNSKKVEITVLKVYPFLLSYNHRTNIKQDLPK